jgi:matrix metalloproteinase-14 (membrane-inserted)
VDAVVKWNNGKVYFFRGSEYLRYDIATDKVDLGYPAPIAGNWPGLFTSNIDYALVHPNGWAYFFKGKQYQRYDMLLDQVNQTLPIVGWWAGVPF